jgi:HD superfamily phosphohydrolase
MACVAGNPPDFDRFIELARVLPSEPIHYHLDKYPLTICYPEKMIREAVALFATRFHMHQQVYTHQAVKQVEFMITDALELANPFIFIEGNKTDRFPNGLYRISEVIYDMKALSNLNDSVLELILASREEGLQPAKDLLLRIKRRQLYKCVGKTAYDRHHACHQLTEEEILQEILAQHQQIIHEANGTCSGISPFSTNLLESFQEEQESELSENYKILSPDDGIPISAQFYQNSLSPSKQQENGFQDHHDFTELTEKDLIVEKMHIHYGMKSQNPVANLRFFQKNAIFPENGGNANGTIAKQVDERVYETLLPRSFEDRSVRLFCRTIDKEQAAIHAFERWCTSRDAHLPFPSLSQQE